MWFAYLCKLFFQTMNESDCIDFVGSLWADNCECVCLLGWRWTLLMQDQCEALHSWVVSVAGCSYTKYCSQWCKPSAGPTDVQKLDTKNTRKFVVLRKCSCRYRQLTWYFTSYVWGAWKLFVGCQWSSRQIFVPMTQQLKPSPCQQSQSPS